MVKLGRPLCSLICLGHWCPVEKNKTLEYIVSLFGRDNSVFPSGDHMSWLIRTVYQWTCDLTMRFPLSQLSIKCPIPFLLAPQQRDRHQLNNMMGSRGWILTCDFFIFFFHTFLTVKLLCVEDGGRCVDISAAVCKLKFYFKVFVCLFSDFFFAAI